MGTSRGRGNFSPSSADMLENLGPAVSDCAIEAKVVECSRQPCMFFVLPGEHDVRPGGERHAGGEGGPEGVHRPANQDVDHRRRQEDHPHRDAQPPLRHHVPPPRFPSQHTVRARPHRTTTSINVFNTDCLLNAQHMPEGCQEFLSSSSFSSSSSSARIWQGHHQAMQVCLMTYKSSVNLT